MPIKENEFRKEIHLPDNIKADLEVQAIRMNYGNMKNMIERRTIEELEQWKSKQEKK